MKKEELFAKMAKAIIEGSKSEAEDLAREAIKAKLNLTEVIEKGYVPGFRRSASFGKRAITSCRTHHRRRVHEGGHGHPPA